MDERLVNKLIHMRDAAMHASAFIEGITKEESLAKRPSELPKLGRTLPRCIPNLAGIL
jgi:hypothetical protein